MEGWLTCGDLRAVKREATSFQAISRKNRHSHLSFHYWGDWETIVRKLTPLRYQTVLLHAAQLVAASIV